MWARYTKKIAAVLYDCGNRYMWPIWRSRWRYWFMCFCCMYNRITKWGSGNHSSPHSCALPDQCCIAAIRHYGSVQCPSNVPLHRQSTAGKTILTLKFPWDEVFSKMFSKIKFPRVFKNYHKRKLCMSHDHQSITSTWLKIENYFWPSYNALRSSKLLQKFIWESQCL